MSINVSEGPAPTPAVLRLSAAGHTPHAVVTARDVVRRYGEGDAAVDALDGVTVGFPQGRFTAIMGPSGSGKSTLMHILAGLDTPTSGEVTVAGIDITNLDDNALTRLRRDHIGFIFQFFNLLPMLTAAENIALPLKLAGAKPDPEWLEQVIDTVGLTSRLGHRPSELSGGQQQRVAVARALVTSPALILADEPTGNLDSTSSADVMALFDRLNAAGRTIVLITHEHDIAEHAERAIRLMDGAIVSDERKISDSERGRLPERQNTAKHAAEHGSVA